VHAPVQLGKLACRGLVNAVSPGGLVHVVDQLSNRRFLVDTGAVFSVFPPSSPRPPDGPALAGAAGQPIPCWGEKQLQLSFNRRPFYGPSSWLRYVSPSLEWIFCVILGSWWTQRATTLWTAGRGRLFLAAFRRPVIAFTWHRVCSGLQFPCPRLTGFRPPPLLFTPASTWVHWPLQLPVAGRRQPQESHV
jgi:hypothetical protein